MRYDIPLIMLAVSSLPAESFLFLFCIFPAERSHVGIDAVEKYMLLILDITITQVTRGGVPCRCLKT
jgi:hypothetical protein